MNREDLKDHVAAFGRNQIFKSKPQRHRDPETHRNAKPRTGMAQREALAPGREVRVFSLGLCASVVRKSLCFTKNLQVSGTKDMGVERVSYMRSRFLRKSGGERRGFAVFEVFVVQKQVRINVAISRGGREARAPLQAGRWTASQAPGCRKRRSLPPGISTARGNSQIQFASVRPRIVSWRHAAQLYGCGCGWDQ
jgi:hypothetical protein